MAKEPVQRLSIWRFKTGVELKDVVRDDLSNVKSIDATVGAHPAKIFTRQAPQKVAPWQTFVEKAVGKSIGNLQTQSASAVLALNVNSRTYAITFGHSRNWLPRGAVERRFGMMATLNAVDEESLRSVDKEEFENIQRKTRTQTSLQSDIGQFGIDVQRDLLRSVTGKPKNTDVAEHLTGSDNLIASVRVGPGSLPAKLAELGALADSKDYLNKGFDWIDHFSRVTDPVIIEKLDASLVEDIKSRNLEHVFLAPPTTLDFQEHRGFLYSRERANSAEKRVDLRIEEWRDRVSDDEVTLQKLKTERIRQFATSDDTPIDSFAVYDSIVFEKRTPTFLYALTGGEWYQVEQSHVNSVETDLHTIPLCQLTLPVAKTGELESDYNARVCAGSSGAFHLLDKKVVMYGGGRSKIEVCDILTNDKKFVHVKAHIKSATLSHLFSQGAVSAQCFRDSRFREKAKAKCPTSHAALFDGNPTPSDYEVVFAIMSTAPGDIRDALPFFSKQSLVNAAQIIEGLGHPLCITKIPFEAARA
jgi:uncharacterized protein (TIGR04141 family)